MKKMEEVSAHVFVFVRSAYNPFLTAVIRRNRWNSLLNRKKKSFFLFLPITTTLVSNILVHVS